MPKIMVVDDESIMRYVIKRLLESGGYEVDEAESGGECLEKLESNRPDLILLDVMMPDLNGWEVLKEIKKMDDPVPVVMLTVVHPPDGMNPEEFQIIDYIPKPYDEEDLVNRVREAMLIIEG